jgi:hypothetical protein
MGTRQIHAAGWPSGRWCGVASGSGFPTASTTSPPQGARVVAAGRHQQGLDQLVARGADATLRVDGPREELAKVEQPGRGPEATGAPSSCPDDGG